MATYNDEKDDNDDNDDHKTLSNIQQAKGNRFPFHADQK